jgi:hypothetical protein
LQLDAVEIAVFLVVDRCFILLAEAAMPEVAFRFRTPSVPFQFVSALSPLTIDY